MQEEGRSRAGITVGVRAGGGQREGRRRAGGGQEEGRRRAGGGQERQEK